MKKLTHPVWGANFGSISSPPRTSDFNSRTPCGVRLDELADLVLNARNFNSRTPCGVRLPSDGQSSAMR